LPVEFRILGPLEVTADGQEVALGGTRQRAVLAILVLHRGEVVSVDRLIDALWGERPPATATKTVQVYVSRLRKALGGQGQIATRSGGYVLEASPDTVDAERFARLAGEGREALDRGDADGASSRLTEALALWRGPPLADLAYESFVQDESMRLEDSRLVAIEDRIEADLALGRHEVLIAELERLVAGHPTRERLLAQLMLALYRSGRQAEALETYREARRTLDRELGLEPGPELQELELAILNQDPKVSAPPRRGSLADLSTRRRGALAIAFGGGLLLAAAVAAFLASRDGDSELAEPNTLAVIDPASAELVATIPTGIEPADLAPDGDAVWVANHGDNSVTRVDVGELAATGTVPARTDIGGLAAGDGGVWLASSRATKLVRYDPSVGSRRAFDLAANPEEFPDTALNPITVGAGSVWVGRSAGGLARVDPKTGDVVSRVPVGNSPSGLDTGFGAVWLSDDIDNEVIRIDPRSAAAVTAAIPVGQSPVAIAAGEGAVWVANVGDDTVSRIDPETSAVTTTIPVPERPTGIAAGDGAVWVASGAAGTVSRINPETNEVGESIPIGGAPHGVAIASGRVWVSVAKAPEPPVTASGPGDDVIRVVMPDDPGTPDPVFAFDFQRVGATCALLYNYPDRPFPEGAELQPEVASGPPEISDDGRRYVFELRDDFRFSPPSDEPVTAEAFARAIERALDPTIKAYPRVHVADVVGAEAYTSGEADQVAGVKADGQVLEIELERPVPNLVERLSTPWFCAVPPDTPASEEPVHLVPSAGPYYVGEYVEGRSLVMRRNPNYQGDRPQGAEEIRFEFGVPLDQGIEEVESGRADYVILDPLLEDPAQAGELARLAAEFGPRSDAAEAGHQQLTTQPAQSLYYFVFNRKRDAFDDLDVRRAVAYALDRDALARNTGVGQAGRPTDQFIPPGTPGFEDVVIYPLDGPDIAKAKRLAGPARFRAMLYTCDLPGCTRHAQILRSNLEAIGITLEVRQFPIGEFFARVLRPGEPWDIAYSNWFGEYPDPANFINDFFEEFSDDFVLFEREFERRSKQAASLVGDRRFAAYAELDRELSVNQVPAVPFASGTTTHFVSARVGCQVLHPVYSLDLAALCVRDED
jgi:YVTN family beta-propeller protein